MIQSIRFSTKKKYEWNAKKIKSWVKNHGYTLKALFKVYTIDNKNITECEEHTVYLTSTEAFEVKSSDGDKKRIVVGVVSSDQVDKHGEIVDPKAVIKSWKKDYKEFPTVRLMHDAEPIGQTLKMWKKDNKVWAEIEIFDDEDKVWHRIQKGYLRAFSIGFRILKFKEYCPNDNECYIVFTEIMLVEISLVDSPANTDAVIDSFREELKSIGGDALVKKMITKSPNKDADELEGFEYIEWEGNEKENINVIELGDSMDKKKETPEMEKDEDESEESEEEEFEEDEEDEEDNSEDSTEGDSEDESGDDEDFIEADETESEKPEENKELEKLGDRIDGIEETLKSLTDVIKSIQESLSSKDEEEDDKDKKIKGLEEKLEEKKKPKRVSHRKVGDVGEKKSKEDKKKELYEVVDRQLKWFAGSK